MKKQKNKFLLLALPLLILTGCQNKTADDELPPIDPNVPSSEPIFGEITTYQGYIKSELPLNVLEGSDPFLLTILNSDINISYQVATNQKDIDYYKSFKFKVSLDLDSDGTSFETSLLTQAIFPLIFNDYRYTPIQNLASTLDLYYLGDGMLYSTLSRKDEESSLKNIDEIYYMSARIDIKSIISMVDNLFNPSETNNETSSSSMLSQIMTILTGLTIDLETINQIFTSSIFTFLEDGFNLKLKENGNNGLTSLLNSLLSTLLTKFDLGISFDGKTNFIDITNTEMQITQNNVFINIDTVDSLHSLLDVNLYKGNQKEIDPTFNLEESYLKDQETVLKVDMLYLAYQNYSFEKSYKEYVSNLIDNILTLPSEEFIKIKNFNEVMGYPLLEVNNDGTYGYLSDEKQIEDDLKALKSAINNLGTTDFDLINQFNAYQNIFSGSNHYSDYLKDNFLKEVEKNDSKGFTNYKNRLNQFFNNKINSIIDEINELILELEATNIEMNDNYQFIQKLYALIANDSYLLTDGSYKNYQELNKDDQIKFFDFNALNSYYDSLIFNKELNEDLVNKIYQIVNDFVLNISKNLSLIDENLEYSQELSSYLLINNDDNLENIFIFLDHLTSTKVYSNFKYRYHKIVDDLINYIDQKGLKMLDNIIKEDDIYKLNNLVKLEKTLDKLNSTYTYFYNKVIKDNQLLTKYEMNFTFIDQYNKLKNLIENEKEYYLDLNDEEEGNN